MSNTHLLIVVDGPQRVVHLLYYSLFSCILYILLLSRSEKPGVITIVPVAQTHLRHHPQWTRATSPFTTATKIFPRNSLNIIRASSLWTLTTGTPVKISAASVVNTSLGGCSWNRSHLPVVVEASPSSMPPPTAPLPSPAPEDQMSLPLSHRISSHPSASVFAKKQAAPVSTEENLSSRKRQKLPESVIPPSDQVILSGPSSRIDFPTFIDPVFHSFNSWRSALAMAAGKSVSYVPHSYRIECASVLRENGSLIPRLCLGLPAHRVDDFIDIWNAHHAAVRDIADLFATCGSGE
ncbi:hypothetical protein GYMLUDRAFT_998396 [Collybiopsis luxurians FD-317 M1]|uniref:Uncharacterized protein n=1 Tax=Collybiopsis luxurians FD-317 M1 TaxID=944289 RepID=A0A0D0BYF6_9AGAR|nr:hypothetical protein GYMLUDRAFT_998396 [Collybiopsis luxurians FD-317 M1]